MADYSVIGKPLPQVNSPEKVSGKAQYVHDIQRPRMLHAKVLRSPLPHARIKAIDLSRARSLPGVKAAVAFADTPGLRWGPIYKEHYIFAKDKVRYVGEEVAAVAAVDEDAALEALSLIDVDYEPLPAVYDPEEALAEGAPLVHEDRPGNLARHIHIERGDVDRGFREAAVVHEAVYESPHQFQAYLEPIGTVAEVDSGGRLIVHAPTQSIYFTRELLAEALGKPASKIRVIQPVIGGAFGGKLNEDHNIHVAAFLALKTGQPVRLMNTRLEEFQASRPRMPARVYLKMGARKDGSLAAKETRIYGNNGAYSCLTLEVLLVTANRMDSLYRQENVRTDAYLAYTHLNPTGAFRGFGNPQMAFPLESHVDTLAEKLGMDPMELRLRNTIRTGETSIHGWYMGSCGIQECIEKAATRIGWREKRARRTDGEKGAVRRGVGMACGVHVSANRQLADWDGSSVALKVNEDGKATLLSGEGDMGQGAHTMMSQIVAEELGITPEDVTVSSPDTDATPFCFGGFASRLTMLAGNAVRKAAQDARRQLVEVAAGRLEVDGGDLELRDGFILVRGAPERRLSLSEAAKGAIFRREGQGIFAQATWDSPTQLADKKTFYGNVAPAYSFVCIAAEVEVDTETGQVKLSRLVAADDVGKALNPLTVEGQVHGEVVQGAALALLEHVVLEGGAMANGNLADYGVPRAESVPTVESLLIEPIDPNGPFGAKGCSETALVPVGAAVANAVYHAAGVRMTKLPIRPPDLLRALRDKEKGKDKAPAAED
ncbi:MAG: xanthine dehydrogenase family protein molybdopterin-binding subunit [Candidatus Tectomicrobia bacterium]|nr:xanthine dehydrogenase family protein molybdopterin-binding subunit [Candidatus Tectomicrobia bacterium]